MRSLLQVRAIYVKSSTRHDDTSAVASMTQRGQLMLLVAWPLSDGSTPVELPRLRHCPTSLSRPVVCEASKHRRVREVESELNPITGAGLLHEGTDVVFHGGLV